MTNIFWKTTSGTKSLLPTPFKIEAGFFNVFGIKWMGSKTLAFFFKVGKKVAESMPFEMARYENQWKQALFYIEPGKTKAEDFLPLFEAAYKKFSGYVVK